MNTPNPDPSNHTTLKKAPQTRCFNCGMRGVREIVRGGECVNVAACKKRQHAREKLPFKKPEPPSTRPEAPPKKAKAGKNA